MFLPLSDAPNPGGRPLVTYALIAANLLVYLLVSLPLGGEPPNPQDPAVRAYVELIRDRLPDGVPIGAILRRLSAYDIFVFQHGYKPIAPQVSDLFASLFLHGGLMHLVGNMLFLWIYGDNVEYRLGRLRFLLWYLATGIAATLFFSLFSPGSAVPLVGASGAISGVLGFYFLWFPRNTIRVFVFLFPFFMNVVAVPARIVLGAFLLVDNLLPFLFAGDGRGGVAYGAHIGGFLTGLGAAWVMDRRVLAARPRSYPTTADDQGPPSTIGESIARGDMAGAAHAYFAIAGDQTRRAVEPDAALALANWLAGQGHTEAALVAYRRLLRDFPTGTTAAAAHVGTGLVQFEQLGQVAPAYQHFLDALDLNPDAQTAARARVALASIAALQKLNVRRRS